MHACTCTCEKSLFCTNFQYILRLYGFGNDFYYNVAICPYNMTERNGEESENYYISIADDTGVLRLMQLPKHLWISSDQAVRSVKLK